MKTHLEELKEDFFKCANCDEIHDEMYIHSSCHFREPVHVLAVKDKYLLIKCAICSKEVTRINFK